MNVRRSARELQERAAGAQSGRAGMRVYGGPGRVLGQTLIALRQGRELSEHENPGDACVHVLEGQVRLVSASTDEEGVAGDVLPVPTEPHRLQALTDATVLLTVAKHHAGAGPDV